MIIPRFCAFFFIYLKWMIRKYLRFHKFIASLENSALLFVGRADKNGYPDRLESYPTHILSIDTKTLDIGPLSSEEFEYKLKGFAFTVIGNVSRVHKNKPSSATSPILKMCCSA